MKTTHRLLAYAALIAFSFTVIAQVTVIDSTAKLPSTPTEFWVLAIAMLTPLIIGGFYRLVPKIPKVLLPSATPFVGIVLGLSINWLTKQNLSWVDMAQAGALAVFAREVFTNAITKQMNTPDKPAAPGQV